MIKEFQPMLAATVKSEDIEKLRFPLLASPKLDGIRAVIRGGVVLSRKLKPIPSQMLQQRYGKAEFEGLDGEFICGDPCAPDCFLRTQSAVMSVDGNPDDVALTKLHGFDCVADAPYHERLLACQTAADDTTGILAVPHFMVSDQEELLGIEQGFLSKGFEGVMLRSTHGPYKFGRSTLREGWLMKLKQFADDDAYIMGFVERMHNGNILQTDERGYAKRTSHQENMVPMNTLGALLVMATTGPFKGVTFQVGTGFDDALRSNIWIERTTWLGRTIKFKYFPTGSKDAPRFPTYLGLRED